MIARSADSLQQSTAKLRDRQGFFVCGFVKSGTTWLERMLDAHPQIACKGEAHFGSDVLAPLSTLVKNYNEEIVKKGAATVHLEQFGGNTPALSFDAEDLEILATVAVQRIMAKWVIDDSIRIVGDKTPGNLDYIRPLSTFFPDSKFIHIVRDGRDVAVSLWYFNLKNNIGKTIQTWGTFGRFAPEMAAGWARKVSNGREAGSELGAQRYLELRYEDIIANPLAELDRVLRFLTADPTPELVSACVESASFKALSGGREPGQEDTESFFRKGVAGDWKIHFDDDTHARFDEQAGALLRQLGYT